MRFSVIWAVGTTCKTEPGKEMYVNIAAKHICRKRKYEALLQIILQVFAIHTNSKQTAQRPPRPIYRPAHFWQ